MSSSLALSLTALSNKGNVSPFTNYRQFVSLLIAALDLKVFNIEDFGPRTFIGEGGEAVVYKSHLVQEPATALCIKASKEVLTHRIPSVEDKRVHAILAAILQELRISAHQILKHHPNIPNVLGVAFQEEGFGAVRPLVVVELACGTLATKCPHLQLYERLRLCLDVADGLVALHAYGIVHGDVKGENALVFLRSTGLVAVISDFGSSQPEGSEDTIPATPEFYAPEVCNCSPLHASHANRTPRDVYSFGSLLCQAVLGDSVFGKMNADEQFTLQNVDGARSYVTEKLNCVSLAPFDTDLGDIIHACLSRQPDERPRMHEVSLRLSTLLNEDR
jgi:serine/threonine protein kinase